MATRAKSSIGFESKEENPFDFPGGKMQHARWTKTFTGDLTGSSVVQFIMGKLDTGAMVYVGVESFDCVLHGRKGTFVITHTATMLSSDNYHTSLAVVPGSGTGELAGISGVAEVTPDHDFLLDYDINS